ncbi:hypothetical protein [Saccharibacillus endophyticus]|uniref:hypothetical protein n=1 Tax=Saccharibacillus endophyticus TaxID=2060666 RepID=UPI001556B357|nr:hypothetical protein [Saccharibacillus endophyticus]
MAFPVGFNSLLPLLNLLLVLSTLIGVKYFIIDVADGCELRGGMPMKSKSYSFGISAIKTVWTVMTGVAATMWYGLP